MAHIVEPFQDTIAQRALDFHSAVPRGKVATALLKPITSAEDLSLAYSPGVAAPVLAISGDEWAAYKYTNKGNTVAVITDGSAILGLGDLGPLAAKPVMEGKAALFKAFAGLDAVDLELDTGSVDEFVATVKALAPTFGGINLEDIKAPHCFHIEEQLRDLLDIPVFHDDQHGTAIVIAAALLNACRRTGRRLDNIHIVINGAGAAGLATAALLRGMGVPHDRLVLCDIVGVLHTGRAAGVHEWQRRFLRDMEHRDLAAVARGADVLIGLSAKDSFSVEMIDSMADRPIVFALANPEPEISPDDVLAVRPDAIVATGRSDYPNQVNNLLAFPYIFRGALDVRARTVTGGMMAAAVEALADLAGETGEILPSTFDPRLRTHVAGAVSRAAIRDGVAREAMPVDPPELPDVKYAFNTSALEATSDQADIRLERDPLGEVPVPASRYFGPQTVRAIRNFPISGTPISTMPDLINALAWVKKAAARTNASCGLIAPDVARAIEEACDEILEGRLHHEFRLDVYQGGAGTSTNMNANEVIANRALERLGHPRGAYQVVHPNDHVNCSQSTNDAYATAVRLAVYALADRLEPTIAEVVAAFRERAEAFRGVMKVGRTQLQDAVPMSAGDEFDAFAETLEEDISRLCEVKQLFLEVNLGGTAIGTGAGAHVAYQALVVSQLASVSGLAVRPARNRIEATSDMGAFAMFSGVLKRIAMKLSKICNDLRLLSSGPVGGIGEIRLPDRQPGSSIMPGKVNPVIPEVVNQVCFRVFGADTTITFAAEAGQLQLNAMEPVILHALHESASLLTAAMETLTLNCIRGIEMNEAVCARHLNASTALAVMLVPHAGYDVAATLAKAALSEGVPFKDYIAAERPDLLPFLSMQGEAELSGGEVV